MGTTAYAWICRPEDVRRQTLESFKKYSFNKIRMLFFPKYLAGFSEIDLTHEPPVLPYRGKKFNYDYSYFNVEYFRIFEECITWLLDEGIEADIILFHNYDFGMWGIDEGLSDNDGEFYLKYMIARYGAYRNIWWSLANEYDIYKNPDGSGISSKLDRRDWERFGNYILMNDPYDHPRSIHNWGPIYPDSKWMTHVSYQYPNTYSLLLELKHKYGKPVINDEYQYEGNLSYGWGNLSGEEVTFRHWLTVMAAGYGTHGECYVVNDNKRDIFWTYGGEMVGKSAPRLKFLYDIVETLPFQDMIPDQINGDGRNKFCLRKDSDVVLYFLTENCDKRYLSFGMPWEKAAEYEATVFDVLKCCILSKTIVKGRNLKIEYAGMLVVKLKKIA